MFWGRGTIRNCHEDVDGPIYGVRKILRFFLDELWIFRGYTDRQEPPGYFSGWRSILESKNIFSKSHPLYDTFSNSFLNHTLINVCIFGNRHKTDYTYMIAMNRQKFQSNSTKINWSEWRLEIGFNLIEWELEGACLIVKTKVIQTMTRGIYFEVQR